MNFSLSTWMMIAFVIGTLLSIWKVYPFLVNRVLKDDDTGEDSHTYLVEHMHKVLKEQKDVPSAKTLHEKMVAHPEFDKERFWRFNENKLNQLLHRYFGENQDMNSIEDIHKYVNKQ